MSAVTKGRAAASTTILVLLLGLFALVSEQQATADTGDAPTEPVAAAAISAGFNHTCVVTVGKKVRCWGDGAAGQLGYGNVVDVGAGVEGTETPAVVGDVPLGADAVAVGAGQSHSCALLTTGAVRCWGSSEFGQLGYGNTDSVGAGGPGPATPADAGDVPLGATAVAISVLYNQTCALLDTGALRCWGQNTNGKLGYGALGHVGDDETPAEAGDVPIEVTVQAVSVGNEHTCVLSTDEAVHCWGQGAAGQLGYGDTLPVDAADSGPVSLGGTAVALSAGSQHNCVLLTTGAVRCWGSGGTGRLGYGNASTVGDGNVPGLETPEAAGDVPLGGTATGIHAGSLHTCATLSAGTVKCWGNGVHGRNGDASTDTIGDGSVAGKETPADVGPVEVGGQVLAIAASAHTCGVLAGGALRCWGHANAGKLGYAAPSTIGDNETPASAGDVPVGALVRTVADPPVTEPPVTEPPVTEPPVVVRPKKAVVLTLRALPKRDRRAPFVFRLRGAATGAFAKVPANCRGTVTVAIKRGPRLISQRRVVLRPNCTYLTRIKVRPQRLGKKKRLVRLVVIARYGGNAVLLPDAVRTRVIAR